jgi:hypothetical protein
LTAEVGYSGKPLVKKLGIKEGFHIALIGAPPAYKNHLADLPKNLKWFKNFNGNDLDMIHFFVINREVLTETLPKAKAAIKKSGTIWVSWPKKSSGIPTDLNENIIRMIALETGLVDVKVCAIDIVWSGLKLVYRLKER